MNYYLFNPESDMALAVGNRHYCPPRSIEKFRDDLSLLPLWYADSPSVVLTNTNVPSDWAVHERNALDNSNRFEPFDFLKKHAKTDDSFIPWGWNFSQYQCWKKNISIIPTIPIDEIHRLSGRDLTCSILTYLNSNHLLSEGIEIPVLIRSIDNLHNFCSQHETSILKAPWSSSGKGIFLNLSSDCPELLQSWATKIIRNQGFVMGEKFYDKQLDFAMEFLSNDDGVSFVGYSLFSTENGKYKSNLLASDNNIENILSKWIDKSILYETQQKLRNYFSMHISPYYKGYFGVDMMIINIGGTMVLHPCVEVNLRMNMGVVSHIIYDRWVDKNSEGEFYVSSFLSTDELIRHNTILKQSNPLLIQNGLIIKGYLPLTYITKDTLSMAYILIHQREV